MTSPFVKLFNFVAEGLEMNPVNSPVKNVTCWIWGVFAAVLLGVKLAMHLWPSVILNQVAAWLVVVSFLFAIAATLLQWNRSLSWHRSLLAGAQRRTFFDRLRDR